MLRIVFNCIVNSQDFNQLCYLYGVSVMCMNFTELTCLCMSILGQVLCDFSSFYIVCITVMLRY